MHFQSCCLEAKNKQTETCDKKASRSVVLAVVVLLYRGEARARRRTSSRLFILERGSTSSSRPSRTHTRARLIYDSSDPRLVHAVKAQEY